MSGPLPALRAEVQALLHNLQCQRPPALRRALTDEALLATDLPLAAAAWEVERFRTLAAAAGWQISPQGQWLQLDKPLRGLFPADLAADLADSAAISSIPGELGCCVSLLLRHPDAAWADEVARQLVKAAEAGPAALERLCGGLHGQWAARLRRHEPLPGELLPLLLHIAKEEHP